MFTFQTSGTNELSISFVSRDEMLVDVLSICIYIYSLFCFFARKRVKFYNSE